MKPTNVAALNKPLLIFGFDPKMVSLWMISGFLVALVLNDTWAWARGIVLGMFIFLGGCVWSRNITKKDALFLPIFLMKLRQKTVYDPGKREPFRVIFRKGV